MWPPFARFVERGLIAGVARPGRVDTPPSVPEIGADLDENFVLDGPVGALSLPKSSPLRVVSFRFPSSSPVFDGSGDTISGFLVRPRGEPVIALLVVPGWLALFRGYFKWLAGRLARRGALVAVIDLPAHFGRTPPGSRHGARFFSGDPAGTLGYLRQALSDGRGLVRALGREAPERPVVACGFSLGAWVAGAVASLEPAMGALLVTPAADLGSLLRRSPLLADVRRELWRTGHDPEELAIRAALLSLSRLRPPEGGSAIFVGSLDEVIPAENSRALAAAWQAPIEAFPVGHMTPYISTHFHRRLFGILGPDGSFVRGPRPNERAG